MCQNPNPFMVGSSQSGSYFQAPKPPKPKPVVKKELEYQSKPRPNNEYGKIVYQTDRISKQQVLDTYAIYLLNKDIETSSWPLYVFGENDIDKKRAKGGERDMIGGLAGVLGDYDTSVSFGITTTFYKDKYINNDFNAFKKIINNDFEILLKYIKCGHNIIVPSPNMQDLHGYYEKSYWKTINNEKTQVIFHNIGTGLACIPFHYIEYIQKQFHILKQIGEKNSENGIKLINDNENINDDKKQQDIKDENNNNNNNENIEKDKENNMNDKNKKNKQESVENSNDNKLVNNDNNNNNNNGMNVDGDDELAKALALSMQQHPK